MLSAADLRALRAVFSDDVGERLNRIEQGLAQGIPNPDLTRDAHSLAGAAATVYLPKIADAGRRLELLLEGGDVDTARRVFDELRVEVKRRLAGPLVLHVEDDPTNQALVARVVARRPNVSVVNCTTGAAALTLAKDEHPDLVLLDLNLADDLSGHDVLHRLRSDSGTAGIPVVVVSGEAHPAEIERTLAAGATEYMTKPVDVGRLLAILDELGEEVSS